MADLAVGMAGCIDAFDWDRSPLGPQPTWPATLRLMVGVALNARFPMLLFWGSDLVQIYNDAFVPILGARHPSALGQCARDCWPEIWDTIAPLLYGAFERGEPAWGEDMALVLERNGYPEQTYFTFSYSRIGGDDEVGGVLCTCVETTASVQREAHFREQLEREHRASLAFQNAALPKRLPVVPGFRFDAMYEASEKDALVGGDWYDAFQLPDGRVVVSVGDVIGNGLDAAVTMAAARQAIRGAAMVLPDPTDVLNAADRALRSDQPDRIVTVFLGVLDPMTRAFSYASAGHPSPMLRHPNGVVSELTASGLPLGLRSEGGPSENVSVVLPEGALLVLYTDGLIESTRDILEGEARLRATLARADIWESLSPAGTIRRAVLDAVTDDVAILTVTIEAEAERVARWSFHADDILFATRVRREFVGVFRSTDATESEVCDAELVFGELVGNAVRHTDGNIEAALDLTADQPILHVLDEGPGFTFYSRLPSDALSESGRGLFIASSLAREVTVVRRPNGGSHARVVLVTGRNRLR